MLGCLSVHRQHSVGSRQEWAPLALEFPVSLSVVNKYFPPEQLGMGALYPTLNGNSYQTHPAKNVTNRPEPQ